MKIYSYTETHDTRMKGLSADDSQGEQIIYVNSQVVDSKSAKLSSAAVPVEEEIVQLDTDHIGLPKFQDAPTLRELFVGELDMFVRNFKEAQWVANDNLTQDILKEVKVDIHKI